MIILVIIFQSTWPQLDISSCSCQSYSVIALILLYLAAPFFTATYIILYYTQGGFGWHINPFCIRYLYTVLGHLYTLLEHSNITSLTTPIFPFTP